MDDLIFIEIGDAAHMATVDALLREEFPGRYTGWGRGTDPTDRPHYIFKGPFPGGATSLCDRVSVVASERVGLKAHLHEGGAAAVFELVTNRVAGAVCTNGSP